MLITNAREHIERQERLCSSFYLNTVKKCDSVLTYSENYSGYFRPDYHTP